MLLRAVLCVLALGLDTSVAFQASGGLAAARTTALNARNGASRTAIGEERDPYGPYGQANRRPCSPYGQGNSGTTPTYGRIQPTKTSSSVSIPYSAGPTYPGEPGYNTPTRVNNQRPPAQYFGRTFAAEAPAQAPAQAPAEPRVPTSYELRIQIDVEKSKGTKDYNRLGQLTSQLQAREALDDQANVLQTELQAAEGREDYTRCQELQEQLQNLEMSMSGATAYSTDQGQGAPSTSGYASYHPSYSNDYYTRGPEVTTSDMDYYGGGGLVRAPYAYGYGPYAGSYGVSARSADIAMRTRGAFHGGGYGGYGMPLGYGGSVGGLNYGSGYSYGRDYYGYGNVY